jgi:Arc/MetJ-type ribon-helix-helix transcriptional regulator
MTRVDSDGPHGDLAYFSRNATLFAWECRMAIDLPKDVERSINAEVLSGHFASASDAVAEAWRDFIQQRAQKQPAKAVTVDELHRQMLADGLLSELPAAAEDVDDDDDAPVEIDGEPLSETIIRERR